MQNICWSSLPHLFLHECPLDEAVPVLEFPDRTISFSVTPEEVAKGGQVWPGEPIVQIEREATEGQRSSVEDESPKVSGCEEMIFCVSGFCVCESCWVRRIQCIVTWFVCVCAHAHHAGFGV